jgi:hypothetical protein
MRDRQGHRTHACRVLWRQEQNGGTARPRCLNVFQCAHSGFNSRLAPTFARVVVAVVAAYRGSPLRWGCRGVVDKPKRLQRG